MIEQVSQANYKQRIENLQNEKIAKATINGGIKYACETIYFHTHLYFIIVILMKRL